ncbi:MAG: radical SAM protein [Methylovirgula sp.]|uniref:radical SAM protein n=1 Tax=Methylovirgula sp. TaxID=1978224 RepID=UPI0030760CC4
MIRLREAPSDLPESLKQIVDYRKSGLSLNHVVGCPLDCGYCVRHLFGNYEMKRPHLVMSDEAAINTLVNHWAFRPSQTPLQIFNRATDPFLPGVKDHLMKCLEDLDDRGLKNHLLIITRWIIEAADVEKLERLRNLKVTILVTWSGIEDARIEPIDSRIAEDSLRVLNGHARRTKSVLYWRPLIAGLNDADDHLGKARELSGLADATVFTGLFYREQVRAHFDNLGVPEMYPEVARRKILPAETEKRVLEALRGRAIFRKTSCGVAYAHKTADYNGHYGIREICEICPASQIDLCASEHRQPTMRQAQALAIEAGLSPCPISIDERRVKVMGSTEQQRYFMQHSLKFQVHDENHPHVYGRHGRAEIGWT